MVGPKTPNAISTIGTPMSISRFVSLASMLLSIGTTSASADEPRDYKILGSDRGKISIVDSKGKVEWEVANPSEVHDLMRLTNGNILFTTSGPKVVEMTPDKKIVWEYAPKPKTASIPRVEIHAIQRLANGDTMVAESG